MPMSRMISDGSIRDLFRFEQLAAGWDPQDFLGWVRRGCRRMQGKEGEAAGHQPFPPLRLFASGDIPAQFGAAVAIAKEQGYDWPGHVEKVVIEHVQEVELTPDEWDFQSGIWGLLAHLDTPSSVIDAAVSFLHRAEAKQEITDAIDTEPLLDAITKAVVRSSAGVTRRAQFFSDMSRSSLWRGRFLVEYLDCWTSEISEEGFDRKTRRLAWRNITSHFATDLASREIAMRLDEAGVLTRLAPLIDVVRADAAEPQDLLVDLTDPRHFQNDEADAAWEGRFKRTLDRSQILVLVR